MKLGEELERAIRREAKAMAQRKRIEARFCKQNRSNETRRKIIIGALLRKRAEHDLTAKEMLDSIIRGIEVKDRYLWPEVFEAAGGATAPPDSAPCLCSVPIQQGQ